jgi:NADH-quinone oxidoreductase subunit G
MATFKLDGKTVPFEPGDTIIRAAHRQGLTIPHYCWHPGLSSPANCRMCLVEILPKPGQRPLSLDILELDAKTGEYKPVQKPKLQPACYMAAAEGMEILGDTSEHVVKARHDVQEFLLLNHPVDCPICDQSGECTLQDYWLEYQKTQKRMHDEPVHKPKGVEFGATIVYDGERCVMCTRCVRFMAEVAKDPVLDMRERGNLNEIFVSPGRQLDGHYTFMTEHVCPVGALTTKDFRFKARVWFLRTAPSVCLRPSLQQGVPVSPSRQREGEQILDVRRGDAHLQRGARRARPRGVRRRRGEDDVAGPRRGEVALRRRAQGLGGRRAQRPVLAGGQLGAA